MQERVLSYCQEHRLFVPGEKVMVAVSGGADSVALLSILCELRQHLKVTLLVVHVNHGFRGAESDADAHFVASLCERWSLPCLVRTLDIPALLVEQGGSAQEVSRRERLRFYREVAEQEGIATVALGHHQDDQAETVLLHLLRGSGAGGLSGMSPFTSLAGLRLVRPLLKENRTALEGYLREMGLTYRTDSSNARDYYARNHLRNKVMPLLKIISPRAVDAITRTAELLRDEDNCLNEVADALWCRSAASDGNSVVLHATMLSAAHAALQRRVVRRAWLTVYGDSADLDAVHVEYVLGLLTKQRGRMIELPRGILALRERDSIILTKTPFSQNSYQLKLTLPGVVNLPGGMRLRATEDFGFAAPDLWSIRGSFPGAELVVRNRLPGDRYRPTGFSGHRKLQDVMSEAGVPRSLREVWPVALWEDRVVWTPGARIAHGFEPGNQNKVFTLSLHMGGHSDG